MKTRPKRSAWSGLDLNAMPHESSLSVLWRFASRNVLGAEHLSAIYRNSSFDPINESFFSQKWLSIQQIRDTNWMLPQEEERRIMQTFGEVSRVWFSENLRVCPICLEHGYHSTWFQLNQLEVCPIHLCRLESRCQCCYQPFPKYAFSKQLFDKPYHCKYCDGPMGGAVPTLAFHLDYREQINLIDRSFDTFKEWVKRCEGRIEPLTQLLKQNSAWQTAWMPWCRPSDFVFTIGSNLAPPPKQYLSAVYSNIQTVHIVFEPIAAIPVRYGDRKLSTERMALCNEGYRSALSIIRARLGMSYYKEASIAIGRHTVLDLWSSDCESLALRIMRMELELNDRDICTDTSQAVLRSEPDILLPWHTALVTASTLTNLYLAMFFNLLATLIRARKRRKLEFNELDLRSQTLIPYATYKTAGRVFGFLAYQYPQTRNQKMGEVISQLEK